MAVSEAQLDTWSAQGSVQQSAATYKTIDEVLNDKRSPFYQRFFDTFLQGSYGNDTNIYADSDVDIAIRLTSVFYTDTSSLNDAEKANYERNRSPAEYSLAKFKDEVTSWLKTNFGNGVKPGKKAIFVPSNGYRRDADVLACAEHREYWSYPSTGTPGYREGIIFWTTDGTEIINYPKQHSANCTTKHQETGNRYKRVVRVVKNMRNRMIEEGRLEEGIAPSYFLEGLLWNVPNAFFTGTYKQTITDCINYIVISDTSKFHCANGIHYLLRNGHPVCWSPDNFNKFMDALKEYWAQACSHFVEDATQPIREHAMQPAYLNLMANGFPVEQAEKVVRHEVGHWIAGEYHGFRCGSIEITMTRDGGHRGQAEIFPDSDLQSIELVKSYLRRRIGVLYAGVLAEALGENGKVNNTYAIKELETGGATNDFKGIRELVRVLRGIVYGPVVDEKNMAKQFKMLTDEIWAETTGLVEANHELLQGLTRVIMGRASTVGKAFGHRGPTFRKIPILAEWLAALPNSRD